MCAEHYRQRKAPRDGQNFTLEHKKARRAIYRPTECAEDKMVKTFVLQFGEEFDVCV